MEQLLPMGPNGDGSNIGINDWLQDYKDRAGESLNLAANAIADVLYTLNRESETEIQPAISQNYGMVYSRSYSCTAHNLRIRTADNQNVQE